MDSSKLSYAQITSIASQLQTYSSQMDALLTEVKTLMEKIGTEGVWSGNTATEARAEFDALSQKFPEFVKSIDDCHKYLLTVVENYQSVDKIIQGE